MKKYLHKEEVVLESGMTLPEVEVAYHTYGHLHPSGDNVIWVCHALTGHSDVSDWWSGLFGATHALNPNQYFIVCANVLGSCYGSTGPIPASGESSSPRFADFPTITIRDMVKMHRALADHLGIAQIALGIGASLGGMQLLEWSIEEPHRFDRIALIATNAQHSAWGIAFNAAQRMAIEADVSFGEPHANAGANGLKAARATALLSYRHYDTYAQQQHDEDPEKIDGYKAAAYQYYQGQKLADRFNAYSYCVLSKAMDSHHVGRGRDGIAAALQRIQAHALVIGIESDVLFPLHEQHRLAEGITCSEFQVIQSLYGHDGFLIETEKINRLLVAFIQRTTNPSQPNHHSVYTHIMKRIGIIGLGCVGQGLLDYLEQQQQLPYYVQGIAIKHAHKKRKHTAIPITTAADTLINDPAIDIIVEVIDDAEAAYAIATSALLAGKDLITANKKMVALYLTELLELQDHTGQRILFEAAVGGSIPILSLLDGYYRDEPLTKIRGILNGTSNYVLTKIFNEKMDYPRALRQAQQKGYAESDPSNDVSGKDAWYKTKLLAYQAYGTDLALDSIFHYGIQHLTVDDVQYARSKNQRIKLTPLIVPTTSGLAAWVVPHFIDVTDPFYSIDNEFNCIEVDGPFVGPQHITGKGAGALPTAGALIADLLRLSQSRPNSPGQTTLSALDPRAISIEVYLRGPQLLQNSAALFEEVSEGYMDDHLHYLIGFVSLGRLIAQKPLLEKESCMVIATGRYRMQNAMERMDEVSEILPMNRTAEVDGILRCAGTMERTDEMNKILRCAQDDKVHAG
jgi:homoserine O-acetyltransferase/O-succinyltransferase